MLVLVGMALLVLSAIWIAQPPKVKSYWVEKDSGSGPWTMESGSRTEEERQEQLERELQLDGPFIILKTTSDVSVRFTSPSSSGVQELNRSEVIPKVDY
jgi:hypothetical protein